MEFYEEENLGNIKSEQSEATELELALLNTTRLGKAHKDNRNNISKSIKRVENVLNAMKLHDFVFELEVEDRVWFEWKKFKSQGRLYIKHYPEFPVDCTLVEKTFDACKLEVRQKYFHHLTKFMIAFNENLEKLIK